MVFSSGYSAAGRGAAWYIYDAAVTAGTVASYPATQFLALGGRGFRLDPRQRLTIEMFGGNANWNGTSGSDNYTAIMASAYFAGYDPYTLNGGAGGPNWWCFTPTIHFGIGGYYVAQTLDMNRIVQWKGEGSGYQISGAGDATEFYFPADTTGVRLQNSNTDNVSDVVNNGGAQGSTIEGICLRSAGGSDTSKHGFHAKTTPILRDCCAFGFPGNNYHIQASAGSGGATEGNANGWQIYNCHSHTAGRYALRVDGADANAGLCIGFVVADCWAGIRDSSYLGNRYIGPQIANAYSGVSHGGNFYALINDGAGAGAANTPGANATSDTVWHFIGAGAPSATFPAWSGAGSYEIRLPFYRGAGGTSELFGIYNEGTMPVHMGWGSTAYGGMAIFTDFTHQIESTSLLPATVSKNGFGGCRTFASGKRGFTENGTGTWAAVGTFEPDATEGINILMHRRSSDGDFDWKLRYYSNSIQWKPGNATPVLNITTTNTATNFGRASAVPYQIFFEGIALSPPSNPDGGRIITVNSVAPTTGEHARGEFVFNSAPSVAGTFGWSCTTGGTPGTWTAVPVIGPQGAAVADATGGSTVDTEARATLNTLLARVRALGLIAS